MDEIVYTTLKKYFIALSVLGYVNYEDVNKILVLIFIQELLESNCKVFITEEDKRVIDKVLYCLYGSTCLIGYPSYTVNTLLECPKTI